MATNIYGIGNDAVTIADGESLSAAINLQGRTLCGIQMPAAWSAANLTFQISITEGGTYTDLTDAAGTEYLVAAAASRGIPLDPAAFLAWSFIKIRSGTSGSPVAQAGDRILQIQMAEVG